jgi:hypothetical protein
MPAQIAIIHGWSDTSKSFHNLQSFLVTQGFAAAQIWLGDYISMDDDVRVQDAAKRLQAITQQMIAAGKLAQPFDLIVHSTGGLVAREWVSRFYPDGKGAPVKRIVMLAPANFGSALAHLGKSMIGRVAKGWNNWLQTGAEMLRGLELASPYQWDLACRDLLDPSSQGTAVGPYGPDKIWPFVIVGSRGYQSKLRQIVNENGSDGTVRAAAANLNAVGITIDFSANPDQPWNVSGHDAAARSRSPCCLTATTALRSGRQPRLSAGGLRSAQQAHHRCAELCRHAGHAAINVAWSKICDETGDLPDAPDKLAAMFQKNTAPAPAELHQYFHVVTRVRDDNGHSVDDYFLEFFSPDQAGDKEAVYFQKNVLENVHVNGQAPSMRALFADRNDLMKGYYAMIADPAKREVAVSISAADVGPNVRYFDSQKVGANGHFLVHKESHEQRTDLNARLFRNTTHLIEIIIPRQPIDKVFRLSQWS